jgi:hypothetical protein
MSLDSNQQDEERNTKIETQRHGDHREKKGKNCEDEPALLVPAHLRF